MSIIWNGYDEKTKYITGYKIDRKYDCIYVFGVKIKDEHILHPIKRKRLVGMKHSEYLSIKKEIENQAIKKRFSLIYHPAEVKGENRNTYILKLSANNLPLLPYLFNLENQRQDNVMRSLEFNNYFFSQGEFINVMGDTLLKELVDDEDEILEAIKNNIKFFIDQEKTLVMRYEKNNYILEIHENYKNKDELIRKPNEGIPLYNLYSFGRLTKDLTPKNAKIGVDVDKHGDKMGWHFHYKAKYDGLRELQRTFYKMTFEPNEALNNFPDPPLYWELHGERNYRKSKFPSTRNRKNIYQLCNNFRKTVKQEGFDSLRELEYEILDKVTRLALERK